MRESAAVIAVAKTETIRSASATARFAGVRGWAVIIQQDRNQINVLLFSPIECEEMYIFILMHDPEQNPRAQTAAVRILFASSNV